jgi:hypothetical protein
MDEVSTADVLLIVTRTTSKDLEQFLFVVKEYYEDSGFSSRRPLEYDLAVKPWNIVEDLAIHLYEGGKIHQPRNFVGLGSMFLHPDLSQDIWIEVSPKSRNTTPAVVQAYEHYKLLDSLTKDHS